VTGSGLIYLRYEVLRTWRNRRFLLFSLVFPLILFLVVAGANRHNVVEGVSFPLYYMTGMIAWGSMVAVISSGARIAAERQVGWTRQLRVTPLPTWSYFAAKIFCGYMMALLSIVVLFIAGSSTGVHLKASQWLVMVGLLLVGLIPFSVMGIMFGHLLKIDSLGPAIGGVTSLFALFGGAYGPLLNSGVLFKIVKVLPSYWLVQSGKTALHGGGWPLEAWIVIAVWSLILSALAVRVYQRDTKRV
jgi:ABC-2 type transport system permease protein